MIIFFKFKFKIEIEIIYDFVLNVRQKGFIL